MGACNSSASVDMSVSELCKANNSTSEGSEYDYCSPISTATFAANEETPILYSQLDFWKTPESEMYQNTDTKSEIDTEVVPVGLNDVLQEVHMDTCFGRNCGTPFPVHPLLRLPG